MKWYYKIIIDWVWMLVWWLALFWLMLVFKWNPCSSEENKQIQERLDNLEQWQQYILDYLNK
jgi:hypothetical protein